VVIQLAAKRLGAKRLGAKRLGAKRLGAKRLGARPGCLGGDAHGRALTGERPTGRDDRTIDRA
jgi:hypothetical protein